MESQKQKLYELLKDGRPHRTDEICRVVYGEGKICPTCRRREYLSLSRVGARVWDLKKDGHEINGWKDKDNSALYWYQMEVPIKIERSEQLEFCR